MKNEERSGEKKDIQTAKNLSPYKAKNMHQKEDKKKNLYSNQLSKNVCNVITLIADEKIPRSPHKLGITLGRHQLGVKY